MLLQNQTVIIEARVVVGQPVAPDLNGPRTRIDRMSYSFQAEICREVKCNSKGRGVQNWPGTEAA